MPHAGIQHTPRLLWVVPLALTSVSLTGCGHALLSTANRPMNHGGGVWNDPTPQSHKQPEGDASAPLQEAATNQAQRLTEALARRSDDTVDEPPPPRVEWIDTARPSQDALATATAFRPPIPLQASDAPQSPIRQDAEATRQADPAIAPRTPTPPDRRQLLSQLRETIRAGSESVVHKAIASVALSLTDPDRTLIEADLEQLEPKKRMVLRQYHRLLVTLGEQLASNDDPIDPDSIADQIDGVFADLPIRIKTVELCVRVQGYGVYEPFENRVFLAGRDQPMIVYAELKHFNTQHTPEDRFRVSLSQEVLLYNESDGLVVWRQPAVEILDESRNERRDFFVVQMIRLPARLTVGKYLLKVRMTDNGNHSIDEATVPIQIVADHALAGRRQQ